MDWQQDGRLRRAEVLVAADAPALERLAARELCRYLSLLTGTLPPLVWTESADRPVLAVGRAAVALAQRIGRAAALADLGEQEIRLVTVAERGRPIVLLAGGSAVAAQWAIYAFLEHLGCGFFLGGDALPPRQPDLPLPDLDVRARPRVNASKFLRALGGGSRCPRRLGGACL